MQWCYIYILQLDAIITWYIITWYCIQHCSDWIRTYIRVWTHKRHPIAHPYGWAMGCLLWETWDKIAVITAPHCTICCIIMKIPYTVVPPYTMVIFFNSSPPGATCMRQWSGSSLVQVMACRLFGAKPLPEPMLAYCQLDSWKHISVKFESEL